MEKIKVDVQNKKPVETNVAPAKQGGHWVEGAELKTCSECGYVLHGWAIRQAFKFCPECGVPMTGK